MKGLIYSIFLMTSILLCCQRAADFVADQPGQFSGVYPHLAYYNHEAECGTGAVVVWADRLWVITYGPHLPLGSSDKLYEITPELRPITRDESIGGTPANRMIHAESNQLFIGPYVIDAERNVRTIPYHNMIGRYTGNARHLTNPESKIYYATMEEGFYEVDVSSLEINMLYRDVNNALGRRIEHDPLEVNPENATLVGAHGKGAYSGQGVLVYSNNGEATQEALHQFDIPAGALAEWDGRDWKVVRRNQFTEVTGPGGIYGNPNPETDPIWSIGWDHKSLLLAVRNQGTWSFYRLPKASHSYDGAHGWNTEWPRIRDVGTQENPDYLMTMHGMFWKFPSGFTSTNTAGIRPRSAYLKVIGDFTRWNGQLVFGCDDSAQREFLNKRGLKGNIEGPGQSNSNLWFTALDLPDRLGPATASGAIWLEENVQANTPSEPFLFTGWPYRSAWVHNHDEISVSLTFEVDGSGNQRWESIRLITLEPGASRLLTFSEQETGEWVRVSSDVPARLTLNFNYTDTDQREASPKDIFQGLTKAENKASAGGLLYGLGNDRRAMGVSASFEGQSVGYYELDSTAKLIPRNDPQMKAFIDTKFAMPNNVLTVDKSSVLVIDDRNRRWRFPLGLEANTELINQAQVRLCREVATERDLMNLHGTFYELPAENADGFAKVRPIGSHHFQINDYASYRGMLVLTGVDLENAGSNERIVVSEDGKAAVWLGVIDDLWKLGKPNGRGGPWYNDMVKANEPSDPYLIGFYDQRHLKLSHQADQAVTFDIEVEPIGHGPWMLYQQVTLSPGEVFEHDFSSSFQARWIRFRADKDCLATAWLEYR